MPKNSDKLQSVINRLNKLYGDNTIFKASDPRLEIKRLSTGSLCLDAITGGGVAIGRITELYGNYSTLKSWFACKMIANAQGISDKLCMYVNSEGTFEPKLAEYLGVDLDRLLVYKPETIESTIDLIYESLKSGSFSCVVVDSIAALEPKSEVESPAEKELMGKMGKLTSLMMRKWNQGNLDTTIILINQVREKIGIMWGKKETTPGGRAIGFFASQRIELRRGSSIKEGKGKDAKPIGVQIHLRMEKDKTGPNEQRTAVVNYYTRKKEIDSHAELLSLAKIAGLMTRGSGIIKWSNKSYSLPEFETLLRKKKKLRLRFLEMASKYM